MKMLRKNIRAAELDSTCYRMECAVAMVDAVHMAMTDGSCEPDCFVDALFGAYLFLDNVLNELRSLVYVEQEAAKHE